MSLKKVVLATAGLLLNLCPSLASIEVGGDGNTNNRPKSRQRILTGGHHKSKEGHEGRELQLINYPDPSFYVSLRQACYSTYVGDPAKWTKISDSDLGKGTYRILKGGCYYLSENIEFEPNGGCCDYWPKFETSNPEEYPMGQFSLGFFAAITIEADDVVLDLNGKTIESSVEFSLKQRFFNNIQFASRVFEAHDGMPNLNLQNGEKYIIQGKSSAETIEADDLLGDDAESADDIPDAEKLCPARNNFRMLPNRPPNRVIVRNGVLGRSSHNGIHGNGGPANIMIEDLLVKDFEVAGIQFNGAKNITIRRTTVGPSGPGLVLGTFSSTRFIGFFFAFYWRVFWTDTEKRILLTENFIKFADRATPVSLMEVFKRLFIAEQVYSEFLEGPHEDLPDPPEALIEQTTDEIGQIMDEAEKIMEDPLRAAEKEAIIREGHRVFGNPTRLPDGGAMYGINLHRRRKGVHKLGSEAWNFYGPDEDSTTGVRIINCTIKDLRSHPVQVPAMAHSRGGILNGPTGEVIRAADMADYEGQIGLRRGATYRGNIYNDAVIAFYKLAHDFWQYSFWGITPAMGLYDDAKITCGNDPGVTTNPELITCPSGLPQVPSGPRKCDDPALLRKRFFGGIRLSPEFFNWATGNLTNGLQTLFTINPLPTRKSNGHRVACGGDTMFHQSKGVFGLKVDFAKDVIVDNLKILNISNTGDRNNFFCDHEWRLYEANQVGPSTVENYRGADVKGAQVTKAFDTTLRNVLIDGLISEEGAVTGVDLIGDENGRSMYRRPFVPTVIMSNVDIGSKVRAGYPGYITPINVDTQFVDFGGFTSNEGSALQNNWKPPKTSVTLFSEFTSTTIGTYLSSTDATTILRTVGINPIDLQTDAIEYFTTYFGIAPAEGAKAALRGDPVGQRQFVQLICFVSGTCDGPWKTSEVQDVFYSYTIPDSADLRGAYAGAYGRQRVSAGYEVRAGVLIVRNLAASPYIIRYFSLQPEAFITSTTKTFPLNKALNYELWSQEFGYGRATGIETWVKPTSTSWRCTTTLQLTFDDVVKNFQITKSSDVSYTPSQVTNQLVMSFDTVADGLMDAHDPTGAEVVPLTDSFYLTHEAGIKDMKRWLGETDAQIVTRRNNFMSFLRSNFSIGLPTTLPPESQWLENDFWGIVPYTESHNTDSRIVTGVGVDNNPVQFNLSRIIEVGYRFNGPQGVIKQGVYLFENCTDLESPALPCACLAVKPAILFRTMTPSTVNELNQAFIYEYVELRNYPGCTGIYQAASIQDPRDQNVHKLNHRIAGSFKFYGCQKAMADGYIAHGMRRLLQADDSSATDLEQGQAP